MTVPVRVIAFPERRLVFFVAECGIEYAMRGIESEPPSYGNVSHGRFRRAKTPPSLISGGGA